jgi:hypothetical protein
MLLERYLLGRRALKFEDVIEPAFLSMLLQKTVVRVRQREESIHVGAGGTGTSRYAISTELADGTLLHLFIKLPTSSLSERIFLTLFNCYDNELGFYTNLRNALPDKTSNYSGNKWCPEVLSSRYSFLLISFLQYFSRLRLHISPRRKFSTGNFVLILEDVSKRAGGCDCPSIRSPYDLARGKAVMEQLARLHASYWGRPPLDHVWHYSSSTGAALGATPEFLSLFAEAGMKRAGAMGSAITMSEDVKAAVFTFLRHYRTIRRLVSTEMAAEAI